MRARQQEVLSSLHAAVAALAVCLQRIEDLIVQVDRQQVDAVPAPVSHHRTHVSFGGGSSVLGADERRRGIERRALDEERRLDSERRAQDEQRRLDSERRAQDEQRRLDSEFRLSSQREARPPGIPALMAATELVHLGYSREEIAERLRERWGDRAAAILREALD